MAVKVLEAPPSRRRVGSLARPSEEGLRLYHDVLASQAASGPSVIPPSTATGWSP